MYRAECSQVLLQVKRYLMNNDSTLHSEWLFPNTIHFPIQTFSTDYRTSDCDNKGLCSDVVQQTPNTVPRLRCRSVRRNKCQRVPHVRQEQSCVFLPSQDCSSVPVKVNVDIPVKRCKQVKLEFFQLTFIQNQNKKVANKNS